MNTIFIRHLWEKWRGIFVGFIGLVIASAGGGLVILHIRIVDKIFVYSSLAIGVVGFLIQFFWSVRYISEHLKSRHR